MAGTIIIGLAVAAVLGLAVRSMVRDKKSGKCSCGSSGCKCRGCAGCPGCSENNTGNP